MGGNSARPWELVAEEASLEKDPKRLAELIEELTRSLDERDARLKKRKLTGT